MSDMTYNVFSGTLNPAQSVNHVQCKYNLLHFAWVVDDAKCTVVTRVCVCLSVLGRMPTLLHGPGCNLESARDAP